MGWMNDFLTYVSKAPIFRKYHHNMLTFGMIYAYSERFVLVLSHDEVVHGKRSLIDKVPGDLWQKCANLRVSLAFMFGHPGKKLMFMGGEFGHFDEWSEAKSLDWFLLDFPHHQGIQCFARDLNHLYLAERAFWQDDFSGRGFEWIDCDDNLRNIISFIRKSDDPAETLIFICNFAPEAHEHFRVGVNIPGTYVEIFNSDDAKYGGSGVINEGLLPSENREWNKRPQSVGLRLPPMGAVVLKRRPIQD